MAVAKDEMRLDEPLYIALHTEEPAECTKRVAIDRPTQRAPIRFKGTKQNQVTAIFRFDGVRVPIAPFAQAESGLEDESHE